MLCTGARILLESLKREGVDLFFGYPGGAVIDIYDELSNHPDLRRRRLCAGLRKGWGLSRYVRPRCDQYCDGDCYGLQRFHPHGYFYGAGVHAAHRE